MFFLQKIKSGTYDMLFIAILWLVAVWFVNPFGDFPLNDDWAYASDVRHLLRTGEFAPLGWTSMSLLTHVLWGALWSAVFGFSFEVLRFSILFISLICLWNMYWIGRELGVSRKLSVLTTLTLGFNPIYFALSFTFMTEVSFMAFVSFGILFLLKYLRSSSTLFLALGTCCCIIATLSRQTGLFLPLAFGLFFLWKNKYGFKILLTAILPFVGSFFALHFFEQYMFSSGKIQALYGLQVDELKYLLTNVPEILPLRVLKNIYAASLYLGLVGLPIWVLINKKTAWIRIVFCLMFIVTVVLNGTQMPILVGIIDASGIGPLTLYDTYMLQIPTNTLPNQFWQVVTLMSAVGAGLLWSLIFECFRQVIDRSATTSMFFTIAGIIYFTPFALVGFYDRYLLPLMMLIPLAAIALKIEKTHLHTILSSILLLLMASFSIAATHDYLAWNRTRWVVLQNLVVEKNIPTSQIDGGFEFGGWYNFHEIEVEIAPRKSWWWVEDDLYVLAFNPLPEYETIEVYESHTLLKKKVQLFLLTKKCGQEAN